MAETPSNVPASQPAHAAEQNEHKAGWLAAGGILAAIAASSCCVLPLVLFSVGISGAWIGNLTALSAYQPLFIGAAASCLVVGFWLVYFKPTRCDDGDACARPLPRRIVKASLWLATALVILAVTWPLIVSVALD
mgnify:FL=1